MNREMTGAEMVVQALKDQGVDTVFGYPGGAVLPIYDAIFQQNDIRHILVRHEQAAAHAAEGYARSTGRPGVVLVTSGPGATNAVTGMTDALMDSIPIVVLTGQVPTFMIGNDAFQEADTVGITRPCTKHNWLVKDTGEARRDHPPGVPRRDPRPPGPGPRRHPEGRPVRHRALHRARGRARPALPAADQGRPRGHPRRRRGAGAGRAPGHLLGRRRDQFRPRGEPPAARAGRGHRLPAHLDADGPRRLPGHRRPLDRHARHARHLRGQLGDARLRLDALHRRPLRRPDHRPHRRLLARLVQGPHRHRPLVDQQEHPRPGADRRRRRRGARRHAGALEGARVAHPLRGDRQVVAADRALARRATASPTATPTRSSNRNTRSSGSRR